MPILDIPELDAFRILNNIYSEHDHLLAILKVMKYLIDRVLVVYLIDRASRYVSEKALGFCTEHFNLYSHSSRRVGVCRGHDCGGLRFGTPRRTARIVTGGVGGHPQPRSSKYCRDTAREKVHVDVAWEWEVIVYFATIVSMLIWCMPILEMVCVM